MYEPMPVIHAVVLIDKQTINKICHGHFVTTL